MLPLTSSKATRSTGICFLAARGASTRTSNGRVSPCFPVGILGDFDMVASLTLSPAVLMTYKHAEKLNKKFNENYIIGILKKSTPYC